MQSSRETDDRLAADLLALFAHVTKGAQSEVLEVAAGLELSLSQLRALHVLDDADRELALYEISARMGLSVAATGRAIDALVRSGLVSRREDEDDRRVKRIAITEAGRNGVKSLVAARRAGLVRFVSTLSEEERDALSAALAPILARTLIDHAGEGVTR